MRGFPSSSSWGVHAGSRSAVGHGPVLVFSEMKDILRLVVMNALDDLGWCDDKVRGLHALRPKLPAQAQ
ncbi:hypothetical protein HYQ46_006753 [Verticillium longisporum]|nr:hypothetical protein HYQ46_006753 [Verticillium longisporum]